MNPMISTLLIYQGTIDSRTADAVVVIIAVITAMMMFAMFYIAIDNIVHLFTRDTKK